MSGYIIICLLTVVSRPRVINMKKNNSAQNGDISNDDRASGYTINISPTSK